MLETEFSIHYKFFVEFIFSLCNNSETYNQPYEKYFTSFMFAVLLTACSTAEPETNTQEPANDNVSNEESTPVEEETEQPAMIAMDELALHNSADSCWLAIESKVYDVTDFVTRHPGGEAILNGCGKDATQMFEQHPQSAKDSLPQFYIGDLASWTN